MSSATPSALRRQPPFEEAEYVRRLAGLRVAMEAAGLDGLILSAPANIAWLTAHAVPAEGVGARLGASPEAVVLSRSGAPHWWGPEAHLTAVRATAWMADAALHPAPDGATHAQLAPLLDQLGLSRATVGVELGAPGFSAAAIGHLLNGAGGAQYIDATGLADRLRAVKSDAEIDALRKAAERASAAADAVSAASMQTADANPLLATAWSALLKDEAPAPARPPRCFGPGGLPAPSGEATSFELSAAELGYHAHLARPLNPESDAARRASEAMEAALGATRAGATPSQIIAAAEAGRAGLTGVALAPAGLLHAQDPLDRGLDADTPLEEDCVLAICVVSGDARVGRTALITEDGAEPLV